MDKPLNPKTKRAAFPSRPRTPETRARAEAKVVLKLNRAAREASPLAGGEVARAGEGRVLVSAEWLMAR